MNTAPDGKGPVPVLQGHHLTDRAAPRQLREAQHRVYCVKTHPTANTWSSTERAIDSRTLQNLAIGDVPMQTLAGLCLGEMKDDETGTTWICCLWGHKTS